MGSACCQEAGERQEAYVSTRVLSLTLLAALCVVAVAGCGDEVNPNGDGGVGGDGGIGDGGEIPSLDAACAVGGAKAVLKRLNLVVIYDRSGSMGDGVNGDPAQKWTPVGTGLKAFFQDPESIGVNASLQYFPYKQNPLEQCNASAYFFPDVPLTALPSTAFGTNIDTTTPAGQTPTYPAVQGAIGAAQMLAQSDPTAKIAIVLVTDGEPDACGSSVQNVSGALSAVAATIPTYVIGIGLSQSQLEAISMAGGTGEPVIVGVSDPVKTGDDIQAALTKIRGQQVPCEFPLPAPPAGMVLDKNRVNVLYTPGSGAQEPLTYDSTCSNGEGWHYDVLSAPTKVILCANTCGKVQKDKGAVVDILFGCQTQGILF